MSRRLRPLLTALPRDPYPVYRALRDHAAVHFAPDSKAYCISRHEDVVQVLRRPEVFSSRAMATC